MKPTRCCVQTQKGTRCANEPSPVRPSRMIGPVRLAACGLEAHQRALWSLPGFIRHDAYCGAFGCDRPSNAGICPKHRDQYRDFGITEHMLLAQEAPMTEPAPMPPAEPQDAADGGATFADILDALDVHTAPEPARTGRTNLCGGTGEQMDPLAYDGWSDKPCPGCDGCRDAEPPPVDVLTEEEFVRAFEARMQQVGEQEESDGEPSEGDIQDAYSGRWGQYTVGVDLATGKEHTAAYVVELVRPSDHQTTDGLLSAILGPRQDTPTLAEVQAELARERERADRAELDAVQERARADEAMEELRNMRSDTRAELHAVCLLMQRLGSYGPDAPAMLMRLLPVESRRALLEIEAADARGELARAHANMVSPTTPEKLAEYAAKVAEIEAKIAGLDR